MKVCACCVRLGSLLRIRLAVRNANAEGRRPMPMTSRRWRILLSARHDSVDHSWFQVAQINEQGVQLLQKINGIRYCADYRCADYARQE
jgi:hypothetical protein